MKKKVSINSEVICHNSNNNSEDPLCDENGNDKDEDIFEAEHLPSYAKTYILPRKMRRASLAPDTNGNEEGQKNRRQSYARKQSMVTPEFQMSILKASIEEKKLSVPESIIEDDDEEDQIPQSFTTLSNSRKSLVPCNAAGGLREYADFVKEGNILPMTVLDPELAMINETFAAIKSEEAMMGCSGRISEMSTRSDGEAVNLDEAFSKVCDMLEKVEIQSKERRNSESKTTSAEEPLRRRGRRVRKATPAPIQLLPSDIENFDNHQNVDLFGMMPPDSAHSSRSSGYFSQQDFYTEEDALESANLLDVMVEDKAKFQSSYTQGETSMELFLDHKNPWNKSIHPALPKIIQEHLQENRKRGECRNILVVFKRLKW